MNQQQKPSMFQVVLSVLASFFGVQSRKNRERDFQQGKPLHFIVAGVVLTVIFIVVVWAIVKLVLRTAGVS